MHVTLVKVSLFVFVLLAAFAWVGRVVSSVSGGEVRKVEGVGPEAGEAIFFGKGSCYTCHAVGERGSAIRGPNQGDPGPLGLAIGLRAERRAEERTAATGTSYTASDYLLESLVEPNVYVVEGYKAEMPEVHLPPIALKPDEVKAVVAFLLSLGGDVEADVETSPFWPTIVAAARQAGTAEPFRLYLEGDPEAGRELFFGELGGCGKCHVAEGRGLHQGPELTTIAATRSVPFIIESIVDPSATVASGYERTTVTSGWDMVTGLKSAETDEYVEILDATGKLFRIDKSEIDDIEVDPGTAMPSNIAELLTVRQFHDLVAYLLSLKGAAADGDAAADGEPRQEAASK